MKCEEFIRKSGTNIYQFCKNTGLDRTTIQKMIKGPRVPSPSFFHKFLEHLSINPVEQRELLKYYNIARLGRDRYECRSEIERLLKDFNDLRTKKEFGLNPRINSLSDTSSPDDPVISIEGKTGVQHFISHMIEKEFENDVPFISLDCFDGMDSALKLISFLKNKTNKNVNVHHFVSFTRKDDTGSHGKDNVRILRTILPFTFILGESYDVFNSYISGEMSDNRYKIWPHYVVTQSQVLLINGDANKAILITSDRFTDKYLSELDVLRENSRSFINFRSDILGMLEYYGDLNMDKKLVFSLESIPCVASLLKNWTPQDADFEDPVMMKYLEAYAPVQQYVTSYSYNLIYGFCGMERFIREGKLPELYGEFLPALPEDERARLIDAYCDDMSKEKYSYMLRPEAADLASGLDIELYDSDTVIIASILKDLPFGFIVIKEPGIYRAFLDYFESIIENDLVYDPVTSSDIFREKCRKIMGGDTRHSQLD